MSYHGLSALQVGFLVAFTQLIPEHQVQVFGGLFHMRVKSLPMLYVTFSNIVCVLGYQSPYILVRPRDFPPFSPFSSSWRAHLDVCRSNSAGSCRGFTCGSSSTTTASTSAAIGPRRLRSTTGSRP